MDESLINYALHYIKAHKDVKNASFIEGTNKKEIKATIEVSLPSKFKKIGVTDKGVKSEEEVLFEFKETFPLSAPKVFLREDFNKEFPHINPSLTEKVNPCIYEGSLDELLLQPSWITGIVDQIVDWLQSAAADNMMDLNSGWEPIRVDDVEAGTFILSRKEFIDDTTKSDGFYSEAAYNLNDTNNYIVGKVGNIVGIYNNKSILLAFKSSNTSNVYIPLNVNNYSSLLQFASLNRVNSINDCIKEYLPEIIEKNIQKFFISFLIQRPKKIIGQDDKFEILTFLVEPKINLSKTPFLEQDTPIKIVINHYSSDVNMLRQFSGVEFTTTHHSDIRGITQIGCGSLGSKIITHLARNGNDNIKLVDNKLLSPHNNARHTLFTRKLLVEKTQMVELSLREIGLNEITSYQKDIAEIDWLDQLADNEIIIDSTASSKVFNILNQKIFKARVVKTSLFNDASIGIIMIEGEKRKVKLIDLYAFLFYLSAINENFGKLLNQSNPKYQAIGQGCGSFTTICTDATISLHAASISNIIQDKITNTLEESGELYIGISNNNYNINWQNYLLSNIEIIDYVDQYGEKWEVRLFEQVREKMYHSSLAREPKESGGVVIGHISMALKTFVVVDVICDIKGSIYETYRYVNGTPPELKKKIENTNKLSGHRITMLGTWHSHPNGSGPSPTDYNTKKKMIIGRDGVPTVCLIYSKGTIIAF